MKKPDLSEIHHRIAEECANFVEMNGVDRSRLPAVMWGSPVNGSVEVVAYICWEDSDPEIISGVPSYYLAYAVGKRILARIGERN